MNPNRTGSITSSPCLRKGGVVALPTDTFTAGRGPANLAAVEQIYQIKTRQKHKPLSLLIAGLSQAYELARTPILNSTSLLIVSGLAR